MKITKEQNLKLEKLWIELVDIPFDENLDGELELAEDWQGFEKGCGREEIWHYFDEHHSKGVYYLLYEFEY